MRADEREFKKEGRRKHRQKTMIEEGYSSMDIRVHLVSLRNPAALKYKEEEEG